MSWIEKTIVALDNMSLDHAEEIITEHGANVHGFKMNHTMYPYLDKSGLNAFADYKLYDIPNERKIHKNKVPVAIYKDPKKTMKLIIKLVN